LPGKFAGSPVVQVHSEVRNLSTSSHCSFFEERCVRSVILRSFVACESHVHVSFIGPGPLATPNVKFTHSSLGVVRVTPKVVPITRINGQVLHGSETIMFVT
jgi:hypothetical protein